MAQDDFGHVAVLVGHGARDGACAVFAVEAFRDILYCALAGFTPSSLRALVMFGTMIIGEASSQPYDGLSALSLSGLILCTLSPLRITQAGFQLSFLSAAAISAAAPAAERFVQASEHERGPLFGLGMQTVTLPAVTAHYFRVPVSGLFLNPVLIPALPAAAGASFAALMTALVSPGTGSLIFLPVHLLFEGMRVVCSPAEAVPALHVLTGQPSLPKRAVCLAVLIAAVIGMRKIAERDAKRNKEEGTDRRPGSGMDAGAGPVYRPGLCPRPSLNRRQKRRRRLCLITLFLVMTAFLQKQPAHELRITFLDVGQGDGIFVEFPSGVTALIDCGSSDVNQVGEYRLEPFLDSMARESPDMVFLTHLDEDHVSGIRELAADGRAPRVFLSDAFSEEKRQEKEAFIRSLEEQGIAVTLLRAGDVWTDRSGAQLACVVPSGAAAAEDENDTSLVLLLTYGEFSALFTGDIGGDREAEICERLGGLGFPAGDMYGSVTDGEDHLSTGVFRQEPHILSVLKAAHHGSDSSTGEALLAALRPTLAVISCGRENRYGHPAAGTLSRLEAAGTRAIVTAEAGCVIVTADRSGIMDVAAPYRRE